MSVPDEEMKARWDFNKFIVAIDDARLKLINVGVLPTEIEIVMRQSVRDYLVDGISTPSLKEPRKGKKDTILGMGVVIEPKLDCVFVIRPKLNQREQEWFLEYIGRLHSQV